MIRALLIYFFVTALSCANAYDKVIAIVIVPGYQGETEFTSRLKIACHNINWKADIWSIKDHNELNQQKYDFVINIAPIPYYHPHCKNYQFISIPRFHFFKNNGYLKDTYTNYDGYLLTYPVNGNKKDFADKKNFPYINWPPTVQNVNYREVNPTSLFHICSSWGGRFYKKKYKICLDFLDKKDYTHYYGGSSFKEIYPNSYLGTIPFDGSSLLNTMSDNGICLVLHSPEHLYHGLPSGRIFEAAASSTVIISDQNSFVVDNFGDSVLYINIHRNGKSIYQEIDQCMQWIQSHKQEALKMAKRAHEIYKEKFLLEDQLLRLGELHNRLSMEYTQQKKSQNYGSAEFCNFFNKLKHRLLS